MQYTNEYGTLIVGKFDGRRRVDTWVSAQTGERFVERVFAVDEKDKSNVHNSNSSYGGHYDPNCSCCYLNFTHTEELHQSRIGGKK